MKIGKTFSKFAKGFQWTVFYYTVVAIGLTLSYHVYYNALLCNLYFDINQIAHAVTSYAVFANQCIVVLYNIPFAIKFTIQIFASIFPQKYIVTSMQLATLH